jgi:hypothetical protein
MFKNNKYKSWHDNIISNAQSRVLKGYKEIHHILPKSLGGSNDKSNLVELTAREHFLVHLLLCKFTVCQAKYKMAYAFHAMCKLKNKFHNREYVANSKLAEKFRIEFNKALIGRKLPKYVKEKIANSLKGKNSFWFGKKHTQETKDKMSKKAKGRKNALGMKHTENAKQKMSKSKLGNKHTLGMICINKDNKTKMIYKNELQNYLNLGFIKGKIRRTQQELRGNN